VTAIALDNTFLSVLLNPNGRIPNVPGTTTPVLLAKERAEFVIASIEKARRKIVLPAPACAELLSAIGPDAQQYITVVSRSRIFEIGSFDARCAQELALLNRSTFAAADEQDKLEPYQKRKVDRQIIAICRVHGVTELYTDDIGLANKARLCSITPIGLHEVPIPESAKQISLNLQPHEALPEPEHEADSKAKNSDRTIQGDGARA
jgi:predicted nucleic acid-binding protein